MKRHLADSGLKDNFQVCYEYYCPVHKASFDTFLAKNGRLLPLLHKKRWNFLLRNGILVNLEAK